MSETAALSFTIDSSQAVTATEHLDRLIKAASGASTASKSLATSSTDSTQALRELTQQAVMLDSTLRQAGTGVEGLIERVRSLNREVGTFQATSRDMQTAMGQLRAAADLFGTSAAGLDRYAAASRAIGQNSYEMVQGLQRIQQALEGTTIAGERARQVLRNYGIETEGKRPEDAGQVLTQFRDRIRALAPDSRRNDEIFAVLGQQSIATMAAFNSDTYRTEEQRTRAAQEGIASPRVLRTQQSIDERAQALARTQAEREDLFSNYRLWGEETTRAASFGMAGPSEATLRARRAGGMRARSQDNAWDEQADGSARPPTPHNRWGERIVNTFNPFNNEEGLNGLAERFFGLNQRQNQVRRESPGYIVNEQDIRQRYDTEWEQATQQDTLWGRLGGLAGAWHQSGLRSQQNLMGTYRPIMDVAQRPTLFSTAQYDRVTDDAQAQGGMTATQLQRQQMLRSAAAEFSPLIDQTGMQRMLPEDILARIPEPGRAAVQRRFAAMDTNTAQGLGRQRDDRGLMRRAESGGLTSDDLLGKDPSSLGLDGDPMTNSEAAERARAIGQAILRIREQFVGIDRQREELDKVAQEMEADQAQRTTRREQVGARDLAFLARTGGLRTDTNPLNRVQNAVDLARENVRQARGSTTEQDQAEERVRLEDAQRVTRQEGGGIRDLAFLTRTAGLRTDANPLNRAQTAADLARESVVNAGGSTIEQNTAALRALTEATISLERASNEALRQSGIGLAQSISGANFYATGQLPGRSAGLSIDSTPPDPIAQLRRRYSGAGGGGGNSDVPDGWMPHFEAASRETGLPVDLLIAQVRQESGFNPGAVSPTGALGPAQILRSTARRPGYGVAPISDEAMLDPAQSIMFQARYMVGRGRSAVGSGFDPANPAHQDVALRAYGGAGPHADPNYIQNVRRGGGGAGGGGGGDVTIPGLDDFSPANSPGEVYDRQSRGTLRFGARNQVNRMLGAGQISPGVAGGVEDHLVAASAAEALNKLRQSADEVTAANANQREVTQAHTTAERELIQARQSGEREAARLRGLAAEATDPRVRSGLQAGADRAVTDRVQAARNNQQDRFDDRLRRGGLDLEDAQAENDNWYMTNAQRARLRGGRQARRGARDSGYADGTPESDRAVQQASATAELQEVARTNSLVRDSFLSLGDAGSSAFASIIVRGGDARKMLQGILADFATIGIRRAGTMALESLFSTIAGSFAGASGGPKAQLAQGGFIHAYASGTVVDQPTYFPMSGGDRGMMGEAGPEAVIPLKRDANGNLGVASGGGGGGHTVNVTVNNQGGAQSNPDHAKNIAVLVGKAVDEANQRNLAEQMRVGGVLNPLYGGRR